MTKISVFLWILVFMAGLWFPGHMLVLASKGDQSVIHISERVKIERAPYAGEATGLEQDREAIADTIAVSPVGTDAAGPVEIIPGTDSDEPSDLLASDELERSTDMQSVEQDLTEHMPELAVAERYYVETGRVDPFQPFLRRPEPESAAREEAIVQRVPRTPLERIGLGQLKLTAIIIGNPQVNNDLAMVEDSRGKGYVVRTGTYVGQNGGRISRILPNKVIVEKPHRDVFGKTSVRETELQIQQPAGE